MGNEKRGWDDSLISLGLGALVVVVSGILLYNFFSTTSRDLLSDISRTMNQETSSTQTDESALTEPSTTPSTAPVADAAVGMVTPLPVQTVAPATPAPTVRATATPTATPRAIAQATATPAALPTQIAQATPAPTVASTPAPSTVAQNPNVTSTTEGTIRDSYTVAKGDSLWKISERFYGTGFEWKSIQKANNLEGKSLEAGMTLSIPRQGLTSSTSTTAGTTGATVSTPGTTDQPAIGGAGQAEVNYTVVRGDSLSSIVAKTCGANTSWIKIASDNRLANPRVIHAGNVLRITCNR